MNFKKILFSAALLAGLLAGAQAASVGPTGYTNAFTILPVTADWSMLTITGGAGDVATSNALDTLAQTMTAGGITAALLSDAGNPPNANGSATWSSTGFYIQTRPTGVKGIALMATLVNNTGTNCTAMNIRYDYENNRAGLVTEEILGHLVYYSFTGAASSWVQIPALCSATPGLQNVTVTLASTWNNGSTLYLLWMDDNGSGTPDDANDIGNFGLSAFVTGPSPVAITTEPTSKVALTNTAATFTVVASGTAPSYFWFKSPSVLESVSGPSFTIPNVQPSDAGSYFVIVSNSINSVTSTVVSLTVTQAVGWVSFNDESPPPLYTTTISPDGPNAGPLTNALFGNPTPAYLTILTNAPTGTPAVAPSGTMNTPPVGTPADLIFSAHENWTGGNAGLQLHTFGLVSYVYTGLDTSKTYKWAGTAVRGGGTGGDYSNRWTKVELQDAVSYKTNHTAGVYTSNQYPAYLTGNQVCFNAGMNNTNLAGANTGDVVEWDSIVPSAGAGSAPTNGTFTILVSQYTNATPYMPAGITPVPAYSYCVGQTRLEEIAASASQPTVHIVRNSDGTVTLSWPNTASYRILATNDLSAALHTWPQLPSIISSNVVGSTVNVTVSGTGTHKFFEVVTP